MAEKDPNRPWSMGELKHAVEEMNYAEGQLAETRKTLKRYRDAIKSFEKQEQEQEAELHRRQAAVRKIGSNLE